ncbi:hydroxyacid dehydrogenase [Candidatus Micrarchaeota archaeon]|nr:hydroxyacid dehydrogenase [Candidatus Micrarchaeota archaeon]
MKIVISDDLDAGAVENIKKAGHVVYKPANLDTELADADALVVRSATKVTKEFLGKAPKLKIVFRAGVGVDNIDVEACKARGIKVQNTPSASTNAVAEIAMGLVIGLFRNLGRAHHSMKSGKWEKKALMGHEIERKTLGIIGCGRIGCAVAHKAHALGMKVVAYNPPPRIDCAGVHYVELDELLAHSDVITIHAGASKETENIINAKSIGKMKKGAYIINLARGNMVDEEALYNALKEGKLGGAALDVYKEEPYKGKLLELENVIFTPHIGGSTFEAQDKIGAVIAEELKKGI